MTRDSVKKTFEECASKYDEMIEKIVPYYHEQHDIILSLIPFSKDAKIKVLDLGIGTGALSHLLLTYYPNSKIYGIDLSKNMIEVSKKRLKEFEDRIVLSCGDIEEISFDDDYDIVVAGLSVHHLTDEAKRNFFKKIYNSLKEGGVFIIRDLIKSESDRINDLYFKLWCDFEQKNGVDPKKMSENFQEEDIPSTMENHIDWLKEAGFEDVDCVWKYCDFAIFAAYK